MSKIFSSIIRVLLIISALIYAAISTAQVIVKGQVVDSLSLNPLADVSINIGSSLGTITDAKGYFSIQLNNNFHDIAVSHIGYYTKIVKWSSNDSRQLKILLTPQTQNIEEVSVLQRYPLKLIESIETGSVELNLNETRQLPSLMGERDLFKSMQLMPGFQFIGEGDAAIYVRGGTYDQNLILLEGAPIYNPSHLLGFYSVFNSEVVDRVQLFKAGIPSEYGNRISSVILTKTNLQIPDKIQLKGNVGLISSNLLVKTPLFHNTGMTYFAIRKTYLGLFKSASLKAGGLSGEANYDFYDVNAGAFFSIGNKHRVSVTLYSGDDTFDLNSPSIDLVADMKWGNQTASTNWNYGINESIYLDQTFYYTQYNYVLGLNIDPYNYTLTSGVREYGHKAKINWYGNKHKTKFGFDQSHHKIFPNTSTAEVDTFALDFGIVNNYSLKEFAVFSSTEYEVNSKLSLAVGVRLNYASHFGPYSNILYDINGEPIDTMYYPKFQNIKSFLFPDFSFSVRYILNERSSLKSSYSYNNQFVHLIGVSSVTFPTDFWLASGINVPPQHGGQIAGGYYYLSKSKNFESSLEMYYKESKNQSEYIGSIVQSMKNVPFYRNIVYGRGRSWGVELLVKKTKGNVYGWIGYTYARSLKQISEIDEGRWFPAKFDRPHNLSLVANYTLNSNWTISGVFVYYTGNTFTPIISRFLFEHNVINIYGDYNSGRFPDYHRLDLSATWTIKDTKNSYSALVFSVYNVYNRKNPFLEYPKAFGNLEEFNFSVEPQSVHIFSVLPSISWQFRF